MERNLKEEEKNFFDNGKLKFEGEYLKGEWNGKGKEFSSLNFNLIYKGDFSKGKWHGKGKEYEEYGDKNYLIFEGEFLDGKRNGKGKEYYKEGKLKFE